MQLINCSECMGDRHNTCTNPETCLCASNKHGESLKNGVRVDDRMSSPKDEPRVYEQALRDRERLEDLMDNGIGNNTPTFALIEFTKLLIISRHIVSKFDLINELKPWCQKNRIDISEIYMALEIVFGDMGIFPYIKKISNSLGEIKKQVLFDKTQLIEVGEWLKGRYQIKRIDLTGNLLFYNDKYYERDAEALIRRKAREIIAKSKNTDMTEVVKYVEDTCHIITWKDIESSIHLKCLNNGIYNIKTGVFCKKFSPNYIILNLIPHDFDESKSYTEINKRLETLIPNKKSRQSYYDFLSTCFHPYTGVDYQFGSVGPTGTGKSQLGILAEMVIGEDNIGDATVHLIAKDQTTQKNMAFKMLNIDYDLNPDSIKQIDVIKKWITQDKFTARGIYEQASTFRPMSRLMFMANDLYEIANDDDAEAIYDRTYIIRVDKKFRHQNDEIKRVMEKTATIDELSGMVTYLLKNATWIYENENYHHVIDVMEVENIWNTFGNRIKMFVNRWIERGISYRVESNEPFNKWMSHCIQKGFKSKDKKQFSRIFDEIIGNTPSRTRIDGNECYAYSGFRIKTDEEVAKEETSPFKSSKSSTCLIPLEILKKIFENKKNEKNNGAFRADD